ncbi:MAG: response regulator transcription factor [Elusimicrobia bacterium]|nr:response regulator transcription factor [Elusimicrobiota bacterium]
MSAGYTILIVEDDQDSRELLTAILQAKDYSVLAAQDKKSALELISKTRPHCAVIDWLLGKDSGLDLAAFLRRDPHLKGLPILIISAKNIRPEEMAHALETGADDFLAKPFSPLILIAKIQALIRRSSWADNTKTPAQILRYQELAVNLTAREVTLHNRPVKMTFTEFELLVYLLRHRGEALDRQTLLAAISVSPDHVLHQVVDKHIENLRKKLNSIGNSIETIRNVGYRLV